MHLDEHLVKYFMKLLLLNGFPKGEIDLRLEIDVINFGRCLPHHLTFLADYSL